MKICSICHRISGSGEDHLDCIQKRRIEMGDEERKQKLPEKLGMAGDPQNLGIEIKALLEHMTRKKEEEA